MILSQQILDAINFKVLDTFNSYCWIAGGAISDSLFGIKPNDIDIFFPSIQEKYQAKDLLISKGAELLDSKPNGFRVMYNDIKFDIIHLGETPLETIKSFDYSICGIAIDNRKEIFTLPNYEYDLYSKHLIYLNNDATPGKHPVNKADRLLRYLNKGYTISNENLKNWLNQLINDQKERVQKKQSNK